MRRALDTENSSQDRRLWQGALAEPGRNKGCFDRRRSRTRRAREVWIGWRAHPHARRACRALAAISYTVTPRLGAQVWWGSGRVRGHVSVRRSHTFSLPLRIAQPTPSSLQPYVSPRRSEGGKTRAKSQDRGVVERELSASCMYMCTAFIRHRQTQRHHAPATTSQHNTRHLTTPTTTKQLPRARLYVLELLADQRLHLCASKVGTCDV